MVHVIGYFLTIGVLTGTTKNKHDAAYVFTNFENYTGWDSNFVSWSVGLLSALYAFFSLDAAVHYSDEIPKANVVIPRASKYRVYYILTIGISLTTLSKSDTTSCV